MKLTTKYNIGNYVYIIREDGILEKPMIRGIFVYNRYKYQYWITGYNDRFFDEDYLFQRKKDAIAYKETIFGKQD